MYHYTTVTEAVNELRENGYTLDFNLEENCISCKEGKFNADEFEIREVYRYEGDSDPGDEATVYGIESHNGKKGILVTGYGAGTDAMASKVLEKLKMHGRKGFGEENLQMCKMCKCDFTSKFVIPCSAFDIQLAVLPS